MNPLKPSKWFNMLLFTTAALSVWIVMSHPNAIGLVACALGVLTIATQAWELRYLKRLQKEKQQ